MKLIELITKRNGLESERADLVEAINHLRNRETFILPDAQKDSRPSAQYILSRIIAVDVLIKEIDNKEI